MTVRCKITGSLLFMRQSLKYRLLLEHPLTLMQKYIHCATFHRSSLSNIQCESIKFLFPYINYNLVIDVNYSTNTSQPYDTIA